MSSVDYFLQSETLQRIAKEIAKRIAGPLEDYENTVLQKYSKFQNMGLERAKHEYPDHFKPPRLTVTDTGESGNSIRFVIGDPFRNYLWFTIQRYPSCCGMLLFHNFGIDSDKITHVDLHEFLKTIVKVGVSLWGHWAKNYRLNVVMVQINGHTYNNASEVWDAGDKPKMHYQPLYDFFQTQKVNTRLMYNRNTERLLHDMEVILK